MKVKGKWLFIAACTFWIVILVLTLLPRLPWEHKEPPPGYGVACDGKGHFCVAYGDCVIPDLPERSRQAVIEEDWMLYNYDRTHKERPVFRVCNLTNN